jgi:hypothetical protein
MAMRACSERQPRSVSHRPKGLATAPGEVAAMRHRRVQRVGAREHQRTAERVGMPAQVLGGRVHHHVGAMRDRVLQRRRGEGVVAGQQRALRVRQLRQRRQVGDAQLRVRGRFRPQQLRRRRDRGAHRGEVAELHPAQLHAALGKEFLAKHAQAGVAVGRDQHFGAGRHRLQQRVHRRHAGGKGERRRAAFHRGQRGLEPVLGGIALARILVAGDTLARRSVRVGRGQVQRRRDRAGGRVRLAAGMHSNGFRTHGRSPGKRSRAHAGRGAANGCA